MASPQVLSIQSAVSYGFAGNSAAVFPLRRAGIDVWPVYTVNFSNHTGYGAWRGIHISAADVKDIVVGIDERGALTHIDAVLSGYQGSADMGMAITEAVALVKRRNPNALYCADPVF
ncbi:MAG: pyridoxal kinase, partial [Propionibacteriaceae bacterium]|nr:pyridoxal kinase [Propionibacteriaceae bacterium]